MAGLLDALLKNESGGRNIANTTQGTSSGQAQGYFQITTGTWNDFGGQQYAATPMGATYEQQAEIASKIPLKRWDESTVALMRGTGKPIDPNKTLGENLAANGEDFRTGKDYPATPGTSVATPSVLTGKKGEEVWSKPGIAARHPQNPQVGTGGYVAPGAPGAPVPATSALEQLVVEDYAKKNNPWSSLATGLASSVASANPAQATGGGDLPAPEMEITSALPTPTAAPGGVLGGELPALGDLFQVDPRQFGQAAALNIDAAGQPIRRRQYG